MYKYKLLGMNVASSKNAKRLITKPFPRLINSELAMQYYDFVIPLLEQLKPELLNDMSTKQMPYKFHFFYKRKDKRHFDYANVVQILADAFQKTGILEDDDMDHFIPVFDGYEVDKDNPGVEFYIE